MRLRTIRFGSVVVVALGSAGWLLVGASSCASLKETSVVPDGAVDDLDAGDLPSADTDAGGSVAPPPATPPQSARIRLANLLEGAGAVDVCVRAGTSGPWDGPKLAAFRNGVSLGEVSAHFFVSVPGDAGASAAYQYRVVRAGGPCDGDPAAIVTTLAPPASLSLRQGGGVTLAAVGIANGTNVGDANPRIIAVIDNVSPPATSTLFRTVHGIPDLPALDVVVNGDTVVTGVRFGSGIGFPYASSDTNGFQRIPAGIPEAATLTLRAGTTAASFRVPQRVRRGVAVTLFVSGTAASPAATLCSDRSPPDGETLANCQPLSAAR